MLFWILVCIALAAVRLPLSFLVEEPWVQAARLRLGQKMGRELILIVSSHTGHKFLGLGRLMRWNKERFCRARGFICAIDGDLAGPARPDVAKTAIKFRLLLGAFQMHPEAIGAVWVDGDTWLRTVGGSDLQRFLNLTEHHDFVCGRDRMKWSPEHVPPKGNCVAGFNTGVFWVRRSPYIVRFMTRMAGELLVNATCDQCVTNKVWVNDLDSFRSHAHVVPYCDSRIMQCRHRCQKVLELCCEESSWLEHWPAHNWFQLLPRVVERLLWRPWGTRRSKARMRIPMGPNPSECL